MLRLNLFYIFTFCTSFAARDPTPVKLDQGMIMGKVVSKHRTEKIIGYYGIPYAKPPVGSLRFNPPVTDDLPSWEGIKNTTEYAPACLQTTKDYRDEDLPFLKLLSDDDVKSAVIHMQEDCLYLNVFVPYGAPAYNGFATIVWIHPGNFTTGSPSLWNPHTLVYKHRVIVVTFSWRLSILGFFTTMDGEAPGNFGLMDQQAAMKWVKNNIQNFGGDPDNICLMGYGTGGVSVGIHMVNTISRDYFNKAIIMSADLLNPAMLKYPEEDKNFIDEIAKTVPCIRHPTSRLMECLRLGANALLLVNSTSHVNWRPVIDAAISNSSNSFLQEPLKEYFERGAYHKIPVLTGYTNMEDILSIKSLPMNYSFNFSTDNFDQILKDLIIEGIPPNNNSECNSNYDHLIDTVLFFYSPSSEVKNPEEIRKIIADYTTDKSYGSSTYLHANYISRDSSTYVYRFDIKPTTKWAIQEIPDWVSVPHLFDLIYVWGMPYWSEYDGNKTWDLRDRKNSDIVMSFWTYFAKTSNLTEGTIYPIRWNTFTKENPGILIIDGLFFNMSNGKNFNYKAFDFWNDFFPKVYEIGTQCCDADSGVFSFHLSYKPLVLLPLLYFIK